MKTLFVILVNLAVSLSFSQARNSTKKDFVVVQNIEILKQQVKKDSLNGIKSVSTKKNKPDNNEDKNQLLQAVDSLSNSHKKSSAKKK